jgi:hypothetical protein
MVMKVVSVVNGQTKTVSPGSGNKIKIVGWTYDALITGVLVVPHVTLNFSGVTNDISLLYNPGLNNTLVHDSMSGLYYEGVSDELLEVKVSEKFVGIFTLFYEEI